MTSKATECEITSSPLAAFMGGVLVVGVERDEAGDLKVYLGARYRCVYVVIQDAEMAESIERAWRGSNAHLWMRPPPPDDALFCDKEAHP